MPMPLPHLPLGRGDFEDIRLKESVKVNSPLQIEMKQRITFPEGMASVRYTLETYLFMPPALQVTPDNFSSRALLKTLKNYIRLRARKYPLEQFLTSVGPLSQMDVALKKLDLADKEAVRDYENAVRRFALIFRQSVKAVLEQIALHPDDYTAADIQSVADTIADILAAYRERKPRFAAIESQLESRAGSYCDEFMSIITSYYIKDTYLALTFEKETPLIALWTTEKQYRVAHYPNSVPCIGKDNETLLFRWSLLKKFVSSFLFIEAKTEGGQPVLLHTLYGVAAAVAMLFATVVAFSWQGAYGSLSMNLFWAMVVAYIFKDRIKEGLRAWLYKRFAKWIPDRRTLLYRTGTAHAGYVRESFRFIKPANLPEKIRELRQSAHTEDLLSTRLHEDMLLYKKEVTLEKLPTLTEDTGNSVLDITRLDVEDFLRYTENLMEELPVLDDEDFSRPQASSFGEKIYHIYLAQRMHSGGKTACAMQRLIINAKGIKRLETVYPMTVEGAETDRTPQTAA